MKISKIKIHSLLLIVFSVIIASCSNLDESAFTPIKGTETLFSETFTTNIGNFKVQKVSGDTAWNYNSNGYMIVSGYYGAKDHATESWLISPEIDLTNTTVANLSFDHVTRYFTNVNDQATVMISENYVEGAPSTGIWTKLSTKRFSDPGSWTFDTSGEISLTQYAGKKIRIAFRYISTDAKAGTWELKNFTIKNTEAVVVANNFGAGTEASPFSVAGGLSNQGISAWVKGTVVGYVWSGTYTSYIFGADSCTQATNLLIADSLMNLYTTKCLIVQLPTGAVRNALSLSANKSMIGQKITLYGSLESYFSVGGLKNTSYFVLANGTTGGTKPVEAIYTETFANSNQGSFTVQNVLLPAGFTSVWLPTATYGMTATAFKNPTNYASESWLISPSINLTTLTSANLRFEHAGQYFGTMLNEATLWVSANYSSGLPATASWEQLTIPTYMTGTNWTFVNSGEISLAKYLGKNIRVAFKYSSTATKAGTWEIKNFVVYK